MNHTDVHVVMPCTHTQRDLCFNVSIIKSSHRYWELQLVYYLHPMWNPQILTFVSFQRLKCKIFVDLSYLTPNQTFVHQIVWVKCWSQFWSQAASTNPHLLVELPRVTAQHLMSLFSPLQLYCISSHHNSRSDKGLSHERNFVWSWYRAEKGDLFPRRTSHIIMWKQSSAFNWLALWNKPKYSLPGPNNVLHTVHLKNHNKK